MRQDKAGKSIVQSFDVLSPGELRGRMAAASKAGGARFAVVRVFGPMMVTRHFEHLNVPLPELLEVLRLEAAQALSMNPDDIEIAWQLLSARGRHVRGIYSAIPRVELEDHLAAFKDSALVPVALISAEAGMVEDHLKNVTAKRQDYCLVNFLRPGDVLTAVFLGGEPVFFRRMHDAADDAEIERWLMDTIRYCCSHSARKQVEDVICTGQMEGKEDLVKRLKAAIVTSGNSAEAAVEGPARVFVAPNHFKKYALSMAERSALSAGLTWGLVLLLAVALWEAVSGLK